MALDILQRFLSSKLVDVGGDDDRLAKLREAAGDLAEEIKVSPQRIAVLTMVAIDAKTPATDPILVDVGRILEKRWPSYAGAFSDTALPVVMRAIVLDALARTANSDAVALSITATARNFLPHLGSIADRELWTDLIDDADRRLEARARREWAQPSAVAVREVSPDIPASPQIASTGVKRDWLNEKIAAASGPQDVNGTALVGGNAQWPNAGPPWSYEFSTKASKAIGDAIDVVANALTEKVNSALKDQAVATALVNHVGMVADGLTQTVGGLERRTSMLWWKEALYSPAANAGYRNMDMSLVAGWAAVDAVDITGPYAPRMAEAFLVETVRSVDPALAMQVGSMAQLANSISSDTTVHGKALRTRLAEIMGSGGRTPLAALIAGGGPIDSKGLAAKLGVDPDLGLSPAHLSLWLFRELQAARATAPRPRRKTGK